jgi:hypothetical protein
MDILILTNKQWMRNAWAEARTPMDYTTAMTGTVLFTITNAINDVTHVPYSRYKPNIRVEMRSLVETFLGDKT